MPNPVYSKNDLWYFKYPGRDEHGPFYTCSDAWKALRRFIDDEV